MNFYNPYYYAVPANLVQPKVGLLGKLFGRTGITISNFLNGTQRVLNIANQTIPLVKQVRPMIGNAKTMFKVMNEFKRVEKPVSNEVNIDSTISTDSSNTVIEEQSSTIISSNDGPIFFV